MKYFKKKYLSNLFKDRRPPKLMALEILKYIGPGFLVTIGFIDPGNWASNLAGGSFYGYKILWIISISTIVLIILQHNAAHLGIASGLCLAEATRFHFKKPVSNFILTSALCASIATVFAEVLGAALALNIMFKLPIYLGAIMVSILVAWLLFFNTYRKLEKIIIGFVSIIGLSLIYELFLIDVSWHDVLIGWVKPEMPKGSILLIMSMLGAVIMPHNMFLHSEIIQSRQWNLEDKKVIKSKLKFEFYDTMFSMIVGWAINSAIIILATDVFFNRGVKITDISQAGEILRPLLGNVALMVFAIALFFAGISAAVTGCMSSGTISAGFHKEPYDINDNHTRLGIIITLTISVIIIFFINNAFNALIISQAILSVQLPITIFTQIILTSNKKLMGKYSNVISTKIILLVIGIIISLLNIILFYSILNPNFSIDI